MGTRSVRPTRPHAPSFPSRAASTTHAGPHTSPPFLQDDLTATELRFLADGVYPGAKVQYHSGDGDGGWATGTIVEPYKSKHGCVWTPDDATEPSRADLSWLVEFGNGWAPVDLRHERRVDEPADHPSGSWIALVDVTGEEAGGD